MRRVKLDEIDLRILRDLQNNGRITNVELAQRAGISAPPCLRRVRALEESGYIRGYHAELDTEALGFEVTFFVLVGLDSQNEAVLTDFEELGLGLGGGPGMPHGARCRRLRAQDRRPQHGARERADHQADLRAPRHHGPDHPGDPHVQVPSGRADPARRPDLGSLKRSRELGLESLDALVRSVGSA